VGHVKCSIAIHSNQKMEETRSRTTENHQPLILICFVLATLAFAAVAKKIMSTQPTEVKKDINGTDKCAGEPGDVIDNDAGKTTADNEVENEDEEESDSDGDEYEDEDDDENDVDSDVPIKNSYGITDGPFKMILCINMSLSMGKGKMCAQCGHATLGAYIKAQKHCGTAILWWQRMGQVKADNPRDAISHRKFS
jgi:Peptidyl-tRNA hydrolase PTH2